jgi:hypothetical protein
MEQNDRKLGSKIECRFHQILLAPAQSNGAWIVWGIVITIIGWVVYGLNWLFLAIPQDAYWYPNISGMHLSYRVHLTNLAINTLFVILSFKWVYFHLQAFKGLDARKVLPWVYGFYILQVLVGVALLGLVGDRLPTRMEYSLFGMFAGLVSCLSIRHLVVRTPLSNPPGAGRSLLRYQYHLPRFAKGCFWKGIEASGDQLWRD